MVKLKVIPDLNRFFELLFNKQHIISVYGALEIQGVLVQKQIFFKLLLLTTTSVNPSLFNVVKISVSVASRSTPYLIKPVETMPKAEVSHPSEWIDTIRRLLLDQLTTSLLLESKSSRSSYLQILFQWILTLKK